MMVQVRVWDSGYTPSDVVTLNITVISINDELPILTGTSLSVTHTEGGEPTKLFENTAALSDDDNCPEHQRVAEMRLRIESFVAGEDVLLDGEGREIDFTSSEDGDFELGSSFGSGFGDWSTESQYTVLTCDQTFYPDCYTNILRSLQYNNTAEEPSTSNHTIILEVCELCPHHPLLLPFDNRWRTMGPTL